MAFTRPPAVAGRFLQYPRNSHVSVITAMSDLDELHRQYRHSLDDKRAELRRAFDALCDEDAGGERATQLHHLLHRLTGSAGTYGYAEVGQKAGVLAQQWRAWLKQPPEARPEAWRLCADQTIAMADLLEAMRLAAGKTP